jgi:hypothetical protein
MPDGFFSLNNQTFLGIMARFAIHIAFLFILIRMIYFRYSKKEKFLFTFFLLGIITFFISSMLRTVYVDIGMAMGLFAIFGILRLRSRNFSVKDMAYTFTTIGISVINSLKILKFPMFGVILINLIIIASALILEKYILRHKCDSHTITYENIPLLRPDKEQKLLRDVSLLTGREVQKINILNVDYKRQIARLEIFYRQ